MVPAEITRSALELSVEDRLDLARALIESIGSTDTEGCLTEGIRRIEEVATGKVAGLTEEQFRAALK